MSERLTITDPDGEIIARSRRRLRARKIGWVTSVFIAASASGLAGGVLGAFHKPLDPRAWAAMAAVYAVLCTVGMTAAWAFTRLEPEALTERVLRKQTDSVQHQFARLFLLYPVILGLSSFSTVMSAHRLVTRTLRPVDAVMGLGVLLMTLSYAALLAGYGGGRTGRLLLHDELFRAFRAKGYAVGFWTLLAGGLGVFALGAWRPEYGVEALPILLFAGISAVALTIGLLNRRAERG